MSSKTMGDFDLSVAGPEAEPENGGFLQDWRKFSLVRTVGLATLLVTLPAAVVLVQQRISTRSLAAKSEVQAYFVPDRADLLPDVSLRLMLDSEAQEIGFVRLEVTFDNTKVSLASEVSTTDRLKTVIERTDMATANSSGRAVLVLGLATADRANPPSGVFEAATLVFRAAMAQPGEVTQVNIIAGRSQIMNSGSVPLAIITRMANITVNPFPMPTQGVAEPTMAPTSITPTSAVMGEFAPVVTFTPVVEAVVGDLDGDRCVNFADLRLLGSLLGKKVVFGMLLYLDGNGEVTVGDIGVWISNYGAGCGK